MIESEAIRILYMEDDAGLGRLFQRRLQSAGYAVDLAPDGETGLEMLEQGSYDLVALDQSMPGFDGLDILRILRARGYVGATVMVTGSGNEPIAVEAMKLGASDYVVKDVDGGYLQLLPTVITRALQQLALAEEKRKAEQEKERLIEKLQVALAEVRRLSGLLPICAHCKKIRNDEGYWTQLERYISEHSDVRFTHGICPDCMKSFYGDLLNDAEDR